MKKDIDIQIIKDDLSDLAKIFGRSKVSKSEHVEKLREIGFTDDNLTNNALVVASIFANAVQGDMKAVEKWQELTGEVVEQEKKETDEIEDLLNDRESSGKPGAVRKNRAAVSDE